MPRTGIKNGEKADLFVYCFAFLKLKNDPVELCWYCWLSLDQTQWISVVEVRMSSTCAGSLIIRWFRDRSRYIFQSQLHCPIIVHNFLDIFTFCSKHLLNISVLESNKNKLILPSKFKIISGFSLKFLIWNLNNLFTDMYSSETSSAEVAKCWCLVPKFSIIVCTLKQRHSGNSYIGQI